MPAGPPGLDAEPSRALYRAPETTKAASGVPGGLCERFAILATTLGKIRPEMLFRKRRPRLARISLEIRAATRKTRKTRKTRGHDRLRKLD